MVYAPDLCQVLWPGHTGHPRLFRPLALDVLCRDTHWAGTGKSGSVGVFRRSSKFPKRNVLGYVCNPCSSREWDAASQCHTSSVPASVSCIPVADAGFTACAFIPAGHYITSPVRSRPFMDRFYFYSEPVTLKAFPERPSTQRLVPSRNRGYIRNLRRFCLVKHISRTKIIDCVCEVHC